MYRRIKCHYPDCHHNAHTIFALVPLCEHHNEIIARETRAYYSKKPGVSYESARVEYLKIADKVPWSRDRLEVKRNA